MMAEFETGSTYEAPAILDDMDEDTIHARMLATLPADMDTTEGGFVWDLTRPSAIEKADAMIAINEIMQLFFPEWSYGDYLSKLAVQVGLRRKEATKSSGTITVTGTQGTVIAAGTVFATAATEVLSNIEFETLAEATIPAGGSVDIAVEAVEAGADNNVAAHTVTLMASPISGVESVDNAAATTGGTDEEDDEDLRERIMAADRSSSMSYVGNDADYKRWALDVDGVGSASVIPEWQGAGTGTVKVIIMDTNGDTATQTLMDAVYEHIISPNNRDARLAPIGAILTVDTATALAINVSASVTLEDGAQIATIKTEFEAALKDYFSNAKDDGYVRYVQVGALLAGISGVKDYASMTVNSGTSNITIAANQYPQVGTTTLTAV